MNTPARALSSPLYRQRVVPAKRHEPDAEEQLADAFCPRCGELPLASFDIPGCEPCSECGCAIAVDNAKERCPWCASDMVPLEIRGHTECPHCHQVLQSCCGDL